MELNLSEAWQELMEREDAFFRSAAHYRMDVAQEQRSRDMLSSLDDPEGAKVVIRLVHSGYIPIDDLEIIWYKLIWCIFNVPYPYSLWAVESLAKLPEDDREAFMKDCVRVLKVYASEEDNDLGLLLGLKLLDNMGYHAHFREYIAAYNEKMGLAQEEIMEYVAKEDAWRMENEGDAQGQQDGDIWIG